MRNIEIYEEKMVGGQGFEPWIMVLKIIGSTS